jgi:hypothetical protein
MTTETKQGLEVVVKWVAGNVSWISDPVDLTKDYKPTGLVDPTITFTYKRNVDWNWNYNVRPVHNHLGQVTHYKAGIGSGNLSVSALYVDEGDFALIRTAVTGSSVPWGYMEIQYHGVDGTVEFVLQCRRIVLADRSNSNPDDDSTVNMNFILFENPVKSGTSLFN